jgi:hypothetical protein
LIVFAYIFYSRIGRIVIQSAIFIFIVQLFTLCYISYENWESIRNKGNNESSISNLNEFFKFSKDKNILHIVTDGFQSDVFNELLQDENLKDKYQKSFQGFIYYKETLGVFPYTKFAIPAFLAAEMYSNKTPKDVFVDRVLKGNTILRVAYEKGFEIDITSGGDYLNNRYSNLPHHNMYNLENIAITSPIFKDTAVTIELGLFRVLPHFLKKYIYNDQRWLLSQLTVKNLDFQFQYFYHTYFLQLFSQLMSIEREAPVYKYIHIMNTHNPMVVNGQCNFKGKATTMNRVSLTVQSKCTLDTISILFDKMKDLGVYDSTLIIIHGAHGSWVPNYRQGPRPTLFSSYIAPPHTSSLASPLLAIKKPYAKEIFSSSNKLASLLDIPATISDIMHWNSNFKFQSLEKIKLGTPRKRFFRFFFYQKDAMQTGYTGPIQEYSIEGSHYEVEWKYERIFYPPN